MGNTIESYRAAIGSFYSVTHRLICRRAPRLNVNLLCNMCCSVNVFWLLCLTSFVKYDQFKFNKLIILLMCMETNPSNP